MRAALRRYGGILVQPRATLLELDAELGASQDRHHRWDGWVLITAFVLGSQIQHLTETAARFVELRDLLVLFNGLALALLTPFLAGFLVEGIIGVGRTRYRHLPLAALVLVATVGNLVRQQGVVWPGPRYLPEMLGLAWTVGLALWIRKRMPEVPNA